MILVLLLFPFPTTHPPMPVFTIPILTFFLPMGSYYILQIIQEDKGSDCSVFRKWGRVGNDKIGGSKLVNEMSKSDAICEFKRLFFVKTGNPWEAWEQKTIQKQPGRFFPLDIVLVLSFKLLFFYVM